MSDVLGLSCPALRHLILLSVIVVNFDVIVSPTCPVFV